MPRAPLSLARMSYDAASGTVICRSKAALGEIEAIVRQGNDARWMRERHGGSGSLPRLDWRQVERLRAGQ